MDISRWLKFEGNEVLNLRSTLVFLVFALHSSDFDLALWLDLCDGMANQMFISQYKFCCMVFACIQDLNMAYNW
jgi:hypothetical protein